MRLKSRVEGGIKKTIYKLADAITTYCVVWCTCISIIIIVLILQYKTITIAAVIQVSLFDISLARRPILRGQLVLTYSYARYDATPRVGVPLTLAKCRGNRGRN